ncbi:MAG: pseudouridine-5'-monophosphatase [Saprospiraceae bacterium]|jgi:pseudouridine-5'-monophosphatase
MYPTVKSALFDMDGLLLDTEIIYTQVTQAIVGDFGKVFDWSVKGNMIGRPELDAATYLVEALDLPIQPEEYLERRNGLLAKAFPTAKALPGAERLIRHLHQHSIPIAIATSSSLSMFDLKRTQHSSWFDLFDTVVTSDHPQVEKGKPAPDLFNVAASLIGAEACSSLVFEDAPSGLAAGIAANMPVVVVPDANMDKARYSEATLILDSLLDFKPEEFGLPAFKG